MKNHVERLVNGGEAFFVRNVDGSAGWFSFINALGREILLDRLQEIGRASLVGTGPSWLHWPIMVMGEG